LKRPLANRLLLLACAGFVAFGVTSWALAPTAVPSSLARTSGPIASAEAAARHGNLRKIHTVWLRIEGSPHRFGYPGIYGDLRHAWAVIEQGEAATVLHTPPAPDGKVEVWGLVVDGRTLVTPQEALEARRANGRWGLVLAACMAGCGIAAWRSDRRRRR
jgi:hypothetical protein